MEALARLGELLDALRAARLYRSPEGDGGNGSPGGEGGNGAERRASAAPVLDTRSNDYLGLAASLVGVQDVGRSPSEASLRVERPLATRDAPAGALARVGADLTARGSEAAAGSSGTQAEPLVSRETALPDLVKSGAGASRLVSGTTPEHEALERELAEWLQMDSVLLFSSAYAANIGVLSALALQGDAIFSDELNHASIIDGCRLSRADTVVVPHRDLSALATALARPRPDRSVRWVVTESYFSMDGTSPDLEELRALCDRHGAALILDETHSLGVFGPEGRGLSAAAGVRPDLLIGAVRRAVSSARPGALQLAAHELSGELHVHPPQK